jgi:hypothetical protein
MTVDSKREFYRLYFAGAFGNALRTWPSLGALMASGYRGTVTIREAGRAGGGFCRYGVPVGEVHRVLLEARVHCSLVTFNESAPDNRLVAQGEVARLVGGLALRYSTAKAPMREAMLRARDVRGSEAVAVLRSALTESSYEDLDALLDTYPDAVVEFGAYGCLVGGIPGRNTVIWEVRNY